MSSSSSTTASTTASAAQIAALGQCAAVFLPADPPRASRVAFWLPDGSLPDVPGGEDAFHIQELTVALSDGAGDVVQRPVPAYALTIAEALPVLTRARAASRRGTRVDATEPGGAAAFWGAGALLALQLAARGRLLPYLTPDDIDAWRLGPLEASDHARVRELAATMPPYAHAVPLPDRQPTMLPEPETLLRGFLDAVADGLPRTPAAGLLTGGTAFTARESQPRPSLRPWTREVEAAHDTGVRLSLRIEVHGPHRGAGSTAEAQPAADAQDMTHARFHAVPLVHSATDPGVVSDASRLWAGSAPQAFGPRAQADTVVALRRAAAVWEPLSPLLSAAVPDVVELSAPEAAELLSAATTHALAAVGVRVHWPRDLVRKLTTHATIGPDDGATEQPDSPLPSLLGPQQVLAFNWRFAVGDLELTRQELDQLAEDDRPLVRLRDQWVLLDPAEVRQATARKSRTVAPVEALSGVLSGAVEADGERIDVTATGWLESLRERLAAPVDGATPSIPQPDALQAQLRDYQLRGLNWLHQLTSLGLGGCLADDMGLGKTVTLLSLHLHRQTLGARYAGPALIVCPASLLGNWQREVERFAPRTPVRRFHGAARSLAELAGDEIVLTTYGTMRRDAAELAGAADWSLVTADEAQHVKNPFSATAKALKSIPGRARVALTGTPVENNLTELWAILDWSTPGILGSLTAFRRRYADLVEGGADSPGGPEAAARLSRLVRPFLLRRRKSDPGIAPELPPKTITDRAVTLTREQAALYEAVVREGLAEVSASDGLARRGLVVKLLTSLKQICNHPAQFLKEEDPVLPGRSGKWELLDELLDTLLAEDASVLVFTQYVQLARLLERHLADRGVGTLFLHGGTPVPRREEMVRSFQAGEAPVFLLSLKAAGTGLNLTRAEHVVHFDRWWNPAVEAQATDRAHRIGQLSHVQVHRLVAEGTVEDRIAQLLARKQALADSVLETGEAALTELTDDELAELVTLRGDAR